MSEDAQPPRTDASPRGPGRPARLSREQIVEAALDGRDVERLTMRELARTLGVTHGALYRWVRNRDEIFDLVSEVIVERVLPDAPAAPHQLRPWLRQIAHAMHAEFLAVPGFAARLSRPHRHSPGALERLRSSVISAFVDAGQTPELAEQSWYVFIVPTVNWLAAEEAPLHLGAAPPRFDLFVEALLRGLPVQEVGETTGGSAPGAGSGSGSIGR